MASFGKSLGQAFTAAAVPAFAESLKYGNYQNFLREQQEQEDESRRLKELAKANENLARQENENLMISNLLGGKIPEAEKAGYLSNFTPSMLSRVSAIQKLTEAPKEEFSYDYSGKTLRKKLKGTGELIDTGQANPYYAPKLTPSTGYDNKGRKVIKMINTDTGEIEKEIDTGFRKQSGGKKEEFDPAKYQKTLSYYWNKRAELQKSIANLGESMNPEMDKNTFNRRNANLEQEIYLSLEPGTRQIVDEHYDDLKEAGADSWEVRSANQDKLKSSFIETLKKDYAQGRIKKTELEGATLWANYKYGFLK